MHLVLLLLPGRARASNGSTVGCLRPTNKVMSVVVCVPNRKPRLAHNSVPRLACVLGRAARRLVLGGRHERGRMVPPHRGKRVTEPRVFHVLFARLHKLFATNTTPPPFAHQGHITCKSIPPRSRVLSGHLPAPEGHFTARQWRFEGFAC